MTAVTQEFIAECSQNEGLRTKHLYFECNNKIENFSLACEYWCVGKLCFGELQTVVREDNYGFI